MDSVVPNGIIVAFQWVNDVMDLLGNLQLGQFDNVPQRVIALNGHDARQDWTVDADGAAVVDELLEGGRLEEQLGDDEVSPCVHFLSATSTRSDLASITSLLSVWTMEPEMEEILFIALSFRMAGGIT